MGVRVMKRINVIGTSGSGKSTFSRKLADALSVQYIEIDQIFWKENWRESNDEELFRELSKALEFDSWVLDGNYSRTNAIKWARCDTVIWLDYGFLRTLCQVVLRSISRTLTQKELWPGTGNTESIKRSFFSEDSIVLWMIINHKKNRYKYKQVLQSNDYPHINFLHMKSPYQANRLIRSIKNL
jgi:ABC-type dipeptide/oligopeptide/nickel transport system ATPase component